MNTDYRTWILGIACAGSLACASADNPPGGTGLAVTCQVGASQACVCAAMNKSGTQTCQADGSYGACQCDGMMTAAGTSAANTAGTRAPANAGNSAIDTPRAGGGASGSGSPMMAGTGTVTPPVTGIVTVPPEDAMKCNGMGTAPMPGEEVEVLEIRTSAVVPGGYKAAGGTVYSCFWIEIDMPEKHHIIGWEGAVGTDRTVHHQQVSLSAKPVYLRDQGGLCGLPTVDYTWTGERPTEWTPGMAGFPIGGPENGGKARFLWQTHFEGATTYNGGFNAYITKNLRKYDAGNFEQGDVRGIMIPPMAAHTHTATCTPEMTTKKLVHPIYVYASMLHAHLTIRHIKAEHKRNGQVINVFGDEMTSGFLGFFDQSFHGHTPCIEILPGDELVTTCDYQNPWNFPVTGGEQTNQEMCTIFMQYFPRLPGTSNNFCGTIDATGGFMP